MSENKLATNDIVCHANWSDKPYWYVNCAMISTFAPAFDDCDDNHDVEAVLRKAKVIRKNNRTDTESCALVVLFSSKDSGENFVIRLNQYLLKQYAKLKR